jgi:hypothetical protein
MSKSGPGARESLGNLPPWNWELGCRAIALFNFPPNHLSQDRVERAMVGTKLLCSSLVFAHMKGQGCMCKYRGSSVEEPL